MRKRKAAARSLFTIEFSSSSSLSDGDDIASTRIVNPGETCAKGHNIIQFSSSDASVTDDDTVNVEKVVPRRSSAGEPEPAQSGPETDEDSSVVTDEEGDARVVHAPHPPETPKPAAEAEAGEAAKTEEEEDDNYKAFLCLRNARRGLSFVTFEFKLDQQVVLYARTKSLISNTVYISTDPDIHVSTGQYEYVMNVAKGSTEFSLCKKGGEDQAELFLSFNNDYGNRVLGPRKIDMQVWEGMHLKSRVPRLTKSGKWVLKFNGKYVVKSQKNAIMLNEQEHPVILIRKIQDTILEIETIEKFEVAHLFALGIASWLCPI